MAGITLGVAAFFRDPIRATPSGEGVIASPADGLVTMIQEVTPPHELTSGEGGLEPEPVIRVSIFMSVFDVHINRAPVGGRVSRVVYVPGRSEEHTSELQSLMRRSYAVFCLKKKQHINSPYTTHVCNRHHVD